MQFRQFSFSYLSCSFSSPPDSSRCISFLWPTSAVSSWRLPAYHLQVNVPVGPRCLFFFPTLCLRPRPSGSSRVIIKFRDTASWCWYRIFFMLCSISQQVSRAINLLSHGLFDFFRVRVIVDKFNVEMRHSPG